MPEPKCPVNRPRTTQTGHHPEFAVENGALTDLMKTMTWWPLANLSVQNGTNLPRNGITMLPPTFLNR
jgi:hypothetical protein